ncbi:MAG: hypothetical protein ABI372_01345, partial [Ginsengibacter sp.]
SYLSYQIEDFRKGNMDDYQTVQAALDSLPENSTVQFANKTYTFSHTPFLEKTIHFLGPTTITRENQIEYTLKESADGNSKYLVLNSTKGLIEADRLLVSLNKSNKGATAINVAIKIIGDTVILNLPLGKTFGGDSYFPAGTDLFKNINFFWVISPYKYPDMSCSFTDIIFDGNRDNNEGTYTWNLNAAIVAVSTGTTTYKKCKFINSPNESIVGSNADIENCTFYKLNGSGFHTSADKETLPENTIHSDILNNTFENTNQILTSITGHSEGAITHSYSGGYYTASGNKFINIGESVLGAMYPSTSIHDWGTSNITFKNNTIDGAGRMIYLIDTTTAGIIHDVYIGNNFISNMPSHDYSAELEIRPGIILEQESKK